MHLEVALAVAGPAVDPQSELLEIRGELSAIPRTVLAG